MSADEAPDTFDIAEMTAYDVALWQERTLNYVKRLVVKLEDAGDPQHLRAQALRAAELEQSVANLKADLKATRASGVSLADANEQLKDQLEQMELALERAEASAAELKADRDRLLDRNQELASEHHALRKRFREVTDAVSHLQEVTGA